MGCSDPKSNKATRAFATDDRWTLSAAEDFMFIFHFIRKNYKRPYTQRLKFNTMNIFYCLIKEHLKENIPFYLLFIHF
jgi:hypothetical protein